MLFIVIGLLNAVQIYRRTAFQEAVVLSPEVAVTSGPGEENPTLFEVHKGLKVQVRNEAGEWVQVSLESGWSAWIRSESLEGI